MRELQIETGEIYHICNKAIEERQIFIDPLLCYYFLETVLLVNTTDNRLLDWRRSRFRQSGILLSKDKPKLVKISALTVMPDHFHAVVQQLTDNGVPVFFQRLCNSIARTVNLKYQRKGSLFVGRYKAVHIKSDAQAAHIFTYLHSNPLDLVEPLWREGEIRDWEKAKQFLKNYQWSSLGVYSDAKTHPLFHQIINKDFVDSYFSGDDQFDFIRAWGSRNTDDDFDFNSLEQ